MKKKILFILHIPPPVHGSSVIGKSIMNSTLINSRFHTEFIDLGTSKSLEEIGRIPLKKFGLYCAILFKTVKNILVIKPNLVYIAISASGISFFKDALVVLLSKTLGKKVVFHMHNQGVRNHQNHWLYNVFYHLVFNNTEVILLSKNLYVDIEKYAPIEKIHFCSNGIQDISRSGQLVASRNAKQKVEILFLSNLMHAKGVFVLLEACDLLRQKGISFRCTFIGGESDIKAEQFNKKVAELDLGGYVRYAGKKYGHEKAIAFSKADIFVFPTLNEAFGLVNLEAMQFSLPIVSTLEGGIPDIVSDGETGFLVEKNNAYSLAEKLEILISDKDLRLNMGQAGRDRYESNFTLAAFEDRLSEILTKLA